MIIYGSKATQVATEKINDNCPSCGTPGSIQMTVFQMYAHVFWIPLFPLGKSGLTQCAHCKQVMQNREFSGNIYSSYMRLQAGSKRPIWTFTGLALIFVLIIVGVISSNVKDEKNAKLILTPQKGDIYAVKMDDREYTLFKVDNVAGDTVFINVSQYETNKMTGLANLRSKGDEAFIPEPLPVVKAELKSMLEKGKIIDIYRKR